MKQKKNQKLKNQAKMNDFEQYRQIPAVNASLVKKFVESEREGLNYYLNPPEPTQTLLNGQAFHAIIEAEIKGEQLDPRFKIFEDYERENFGENPNRRKKDYQDWKKNLSNDIVFFDKNIAIAADYLINSSIFDYLKKMNGEAEKNIIGTTQILSWIGEPKDITLKGRCDYLISQKKLIVDWKTISDIPTEKNLYWNYKKLHYDIQAGFYSQLTEIEFGEPFDFLFVFVQSKEPFEIGLLLIPGHEAISIFNANQHYIYRTYEVCFEGAKPKYIYEKQQSDFNKLGAFYHL